MPKCISGGRVGSQTPNELVVITPKLAAQMIKYFLISAVLLAHCTAKSNRVGGETGCKDKTKRRPEKADKKQCYGKKFRC